MDRQMLRDWVHRYNAEGLAGLSNLRGAPRPRLLDPGQVSELVAWLEAGPDPVVDGVVRWRRQDLQRRITDRLGVELHERTVGKYLAALGYRRRRNFRVIRNPPIRRLQPPGRPRHDEDHRHRHP